MGDPSGLLANAAHEESRRPRRSGLGCGFLLLLTGAACLSFLWFYGGDVLIAVGWFLTVKDELQPADLILVLSGGVSDRPREAGRLYARGLAPRIALTRNELSPAEVEKLIPEEIDLAKELLERSGVPAEAVMELPMPGRASSTFEEALALRSLVTAEGLQRVIIVTNGYHSRRARWVFRRVLRGTSVELLMAPADCWRFDETNWWQSETGLMTYVNEYIKFAYYLWKYWSPPTAHSGGRANK